MQLQSSSQPRGPGALKQHPLIVARRKAQRNCWKALQPRMKQIGNCNSGAECKHALSDEPRSRAAPRSMVVPIGSKPLGSDDAVPINYEVLPGLRRREFHTRDCGASVICHAESGAALVGTLLMRTCCAQQQINREHHLPVRPQISMCEFCPRDTLRYLSLSR